VIGLIHYDAHGVIVSDADAFAADDGASALSASASSAIAATPVAPAKVDPTTIGVDASANVAGECACVCMIVRDSYL
jgi:hypothetical protein